VRGRALKNATRNPRLLVRLVVSHSLTHHKQHLESWIAHSALKTRVSTLEAPSRLRLRQATRPIFFHTLEDINGRAHRQERPAAALRLRIEAAAAAAIAETPGKVLPFAPD